MKRGIAMAVLVGALVVPLGAQAGEDPVQTVAGSITAPSRFYADPTGAWPGLGRRLWLAAAGTNGTVSWIFRIDPETWNGAFAVKDVTDATGMADLGIYFYEDFGDIAGDEQPTTVGEFETVAPGGETGIVPEGAYRGLVFTKDGVDSRFTYEAFAPAV
jgi:hypothetical protein